MSAEDKEIRELERRDVKVIDTPTSLGRHAIWATNGAGTPSFHEIDIRAGNIIRSGGSLLYNNTIGGDANRIWSVPRAGGSSASIARELSTADFSVVQFNDVYLTVGTKKSESMSIGGDSDNVWISWNGNTLNARDQRGELSASDLSIVANTSEAVASYDPRNFWSTDGDGEAFWTVNGDEVEGNSLDEMSVSDYSVVAQETMAFNGTGIAGSATQRYIHEPGVIDTFYRWSPGGSAISICEADLSIIDIGGK